MLIDPSNILLNKFVIKTGENRYKNRNNKFITATSENSIYENFFNKTYIYDINYIKNILYNNYKDTYCCNHSIIILSYIILSQLILY